MTVEQAKKVISEEFKNLFDSPYAYYEGSDLVLLGPFRAVVLDLTYRPQDSLDYLRAIDGDPLNINQQ